MNDKELIEIWKEYLESRNHADLDKIIEELINRNVEIDII